LGCDPYRGHSPKHQKKETQMTIKPLYAAVLLFGLFGPTVAVAQDQCAELKQACLMKRQLGEQGEGNCKKYRACRQQACAELREACMFKRERGEQGQGNCRTYRETCRR
jgi:hypothetical protein